MNFKLAIFTIAQEPNGSLLGTANFLLKNLRGFSVENFPGPEGVELSEELRDIQFTLYGVASEIKRKYSQCISRELPEPELKKYNSMLNMLLRSVSFLFDPNWD